MNKKRVLGAFIASLLALPVSACNGDGGKKHADPTVAGSAAAMGLEASVGEVKTAAKTATRDPMKLYQRSCIACHAGGSPGVPTSFDPSAWQNRMKKGMPALVNSVVKGIEGMPAMGFCTDCSEQEIEALIRLMVEPKS